MVFLAEYLKLLDDSSQTKKLYCCVRVTTKLNQKNKPDLHNQGLDKKKNISKLQNTRFEHQQLVRASLGR